MSYLHACAHINDGLGLGVKREVGGHAPNKQTWKDIEERPFLSGLYKALSTSWD